MTVHSVGVPWAPQLPSDWTVGRIRWDMTAVAGATPETNKDEFWLDGDDATGLRWVAIGDMSRRDKVGATAKRISEEAARSKRLTLGMPGTVLLAMYASVGEVSILDVPATWNQAVLGLTPRRGRVEGRFMAYVLRAMRGYMLGEVRSNTQDNLNAAQVTDMRFPKPPLNEQRRIADFLDRETAEIDALIAKQEKLIDTLRERRLATITSIVTGRELPGADLIRSRIPWLDLIPSHWVETRFGRDTVVSGGQVDPTVEPWASRVLIAPNHVESGTGRLIGTVTAKEQGADSGKCVVRAGQVVYSKIRPALNKVTIAPFDCLCSADMYAISGRDGKVDHKFLAYWMLARPFVTYSSLTSARVKMPKINREELAGAPWARPPVEEQRAIVREIESQVAKIDALIAKANEFIALARERRAALITEAVTGRIDVTTGKVRAGV